MNDRYYIANIKNIPTEELFKDLENYGFDSYYKDLWYATTQELKRRCEDRVQGEWVLTTKGVGGVNVYECSECGHVIFDYPRNIRKKYKGCYCGAIMKGVRK